MTITTNERDSFGIRPMDKRDIDEVVRVHLESFQGFFLTFLGPSFLSVLYSFLAADKQSISFVACSTQNARIVGFVVGALEPSSLYRRAIRSRLLTFAFYTVPALIRDPRILGHLVRALTKPKEMKAIPADCELMSIAVLPQHANQGIGKKLEAAFINEARNHGAHSITLTTDKLNNDAVNKFYEKCGYAVYDSFVTREGREMNRYMKKI